jgi:hypothetical protein
MFIFYHKTTWKLTHLPQLLPGVIIYQLGIFLNPCVISSKATPIILDGAQRFEPFHGNAAGAAITPAGYPGSTNPGDFAMLLRRVSDCAGDTQPDGFSYSFTDPYRHLDSHCFSLAFTGHHALSTNFAHP